MSLHEYELAKELRSRDQPFYALIMAAMLRADTRNAALLRASFPDTWAELQARYDAPGGRLQSD